jgi:hypothetical protein
MVRMPAGPSALPASLGVRAEYLTAFSGYAEAITENRVPIQGSGLYGLGNLMALHWILAVAVPVILYTLYFLTVMLLRGMWGRSPDERDPSRSRDRRLVAQRCLCAAGATWGAMGVNRQHRELDETKGKRRHASVWSGGVAHDTPYRTGTQDVDVSNPLCVTRYSLTPLQCR